ncbi:hypothetical protein SAMN05428964_103364 [Thalassospira xiamenensis]|uniref:Uncharacterized protein n=1 Tax=Thalassospira xiamenensis TaxID=220697 RepID=A0A285TKS9_9PROT|nr:hypothetical protein SAMN05428964_103364 [Thalassospira xiamenensis]
MTTKPGHPPDLRKPNHQTPHKPPKTSLPASAASGNGMITNPGRTSGLHQPSPADGPLTVDNLAARSAHFRQCHEHRRPDKTRASSNRRRRTIIWLSAALISVRPRRQPATSTSRHTSGHRHRHQQMIQGLAAHFGHFPATATTCHADIQTHLGPLPFSPADGLRAHCPNLSTTDGPQSDAVTAAIAAASGKSGVRSPIRRTSPVMTNKGIKSVLEPVRNAAVMAPPSADPYPADYPAALPQSLPLHPDHLFDLAPNAKTREAQGASRVSVRVHFSR